jgi:hypothetical protein
MEIAQLRARAKMVAGTGRTTENGRNWMNDEEQAVVGRRWSTTVVGRAWWSMVGRKWVDGEREEKFGGKLGGKVGTEMGKWEYCSGFDFKF